MGLSLRLHTGRGAISFQRSHSPPLRVISLRVSTLQLREIKRISRTGLCACSPIVSPFAASSCGCSHHVRLSTGRTVSVLLKRDILGQRIGARRDLSEQRRRRVYKLKVKSKNSEGSDSSGGARDGEWVVVAAGSVLTIGVGVYLAQSLTKPVAQPSWSYKQFSPTAWLLVPLWGAILLNFILQAGLWVSLARSRKRSKDIDFSDFTLKERVVKLEEDARETVSIVRILSRQVEKLGVRFRVMRRTLRDPIQEAAGLAQKTSEVVTLLTRREDMLEKELQNLQHSLLAIQDQQAKQLALVASVAGKMLNGLRVLDEKTKDLGREVQRSGTGSSQALTKTPISSSADVAESKGSGAPSVKKVEEDFMHRLGDLGSSLPMNHGVGSKVIMNGRVHAVTTNGQERAVGTELKDQTNGAPDSDIESNSSGSKTNTFHPEQSLSRIDFWKEPLDHDILRSSPSPEPEVDTQSEAGLRTVFRSRKKYVTDQDAQPNKRRGGTSLDALGAGESGDSDDELEIIEQPDYESDSWLR